MITISGATIKDVIKQGYIKLYNSTEQVSDPAVLKEEATVMTITNDITPENYFEVVDDRLVYNFDHLSYIPSVEEAKLQEEATYWHDVLIKTGAREKITSHLKQNPYSRRALINLWDESHFNEVNKGGACITQLYFRVKGDCLELHTHARANDIHRCMLMDLHMMSAMHIWISEDLGLRVGKYIHFIDAMHMYKKYENDITTQLDILSKSTLWN